MRQRLSPIDALVNLPHLADESDRRANWRQALAALGQSAKVLGPPPLDGVEPDKLIDAVRVALDTSLVDDLDWFEPSHAAVALYELTSALPAGTERRDLGRRVYYRLYEGNASTVAAVSTRMALGAARSLDTPALRARVSLLFELPIGSSVKADPLALSLVARRETFERWVGHPSTGALPARRLAARLVEHASREALVRSQQGDSYPRQLLLSNEIVPTLQRLLADREPLVWQHAAAARGLLASMDHATRQDVELALDPSLTPTEWRRAAVSLVALVSVDPETALKQCRRLVGGEIAHADPGVLATMVYGLPRVLEAEPDAADSLLELLVASRRGDVAEALARLVVDLSSRTFGVRTLELIRKSLTTARNNPMGIGQAIAERGLRLLDHDHVDSSLAEGVRQALVAFETAGARAAHEAALATAQAALDALGELEHTESEASEADTAVPAIAQLADLDATCLERSSLVDLLLLNRRPGELDSSVPPMERLYHRLGHWLLDTEMRFSEQDFSSGTYQARQQRLRALLHLVDAETVRSDSEAAEQRLKSLLRRATKVLLDEIAKGPDASVHRILCATLARTFDADVRESVAEPSDIFLVVLDTVTDRESISTIAEASTNPDVRAPFAALSGFLGAHVGEAHDPVLDMPSSPDQEMLGADEAVVARRVVRLSQAIGAGGSYRAEALRQVVMRLGRSLETIASARGLTELVDRNRSGVDALRDLEQATNALLEMIRGASRRLLEVPPSPPTGGRKATSLSVLVERAVADSASADAGKVALATAELVDELPACLAAAVGTVCSRIDTLPIAAGSDVYAIPLEKRRAPLPDWLLPRRTIGSFYVVRALGSGGVSSVFVARRVEERHDPRAPLFALKVPEYDPTTARSLSEKEFLSLFRDEAGALLSLPHHPNLARFVTFDLAARPKPILVTDLISGFGLDRLIRSRALTIERAFGFLDGILAGLEAMHQVGVGHLDLKPSNVILKNNQVAVLVDFGLSGRKIRPGCGTLDYCAPEVLGVTPEPSAAAPPAADVYAFGSLAFEVFTSQPLFDGPDEMALVTQHVSHDGWPDRLARYAHHPLTAELASVLAACLRHDPRHRPAVSALRQALSELKPKLSDAAWPLICERASRHSQSA